MSHAPAPRPVPPSPKKPCSGLTWPPPDEDLEESPEHRPQTPAEIKDGGMQAVHPLAVEISPETDALTLFLSEGPVVDPPAPPPSDSSLGVSGARPVARIVRRRPEALQTSPDCSPPSSSPADSTQARSDGEDREHSGTEPTSTSDIAVSPSAAGALRGSTDLADEIAHLQTLIEQLTEKIDWRIPADGVTEISHD